MSRLTLNSVTFDFFFSNVPLDNFKLGFEWSFDFVSGLFGRCKKDLE